MYEIRLKDTSQLIEAFNGKITFEKNKPGLLTFSLYPNSYFYEKLEPYITDLAVYYDNKKVFDGQVISVNDGMDSNGIFTYDVYCVDRWDYLNRTKTGRWDIHPGTYTPNTTTTIDTLDPYEIKENMNVQKYVQLILDNHNSKVADNRKIYLGNVTKSDNVTCTADRETSLKELQTLAENKEAYIDIREVDDKLYLDFLEDIEITGSKLEKGINIASIERQGTLETVITRLIPVGKDGLTIKSVNNNKEYIEDAILKAKYGVIEEVVKWDDVTVPSNLLNKAKVYLASCNENSYSITITSKDLSYIDLNFNRFKLHQECEIFVDTLDVWQKHKIIKIEIDLDNPQDSKLTFCNSTASLIRKTSNFKKSLENTLKNVEKTNYDNSTFKIETNTKIEAISTNSYREKIFRIMGVL